MAKGLYSFAVGEQIVQSIPDCGDVLLTYIGCEMWEDRFGSVTPTQDITVAGATWRAADKP